MIKDVKFLMNFNPNNDKKFDFNTNPKEGHIIDNVPYVSQENSFLCAFASPTMIFQYFNIDINLAGFLFNSGVGYSLIYNQPHFRYCLGGGFFTSQWSLDKAFVADLYGLKYEFWIPTDISSSIHEKWNQYWKILKGYLKKDIPVSTSIDVFTLPLTKKILKSYSWIDMNKVPDFLWKSFTTAHEIVIVGFDEEKKLIYYNDPVTSVIGSKRDGLYASVSIDIFAKAVSQARLGDFFPNFQINIYKKINNPLPKELVFLKSHNRNIEKIKGNVLSYDHYWRNYPLGINALFSFRKDFEMILDNKRSDMISSYKIDTLKLAIFKKLFFLFGKKTSIPMIKDIFYNLYKIIAIEKEYVTEYLKNDSIDIKGLDVEMEYIKDEIDEWNTLSNYYSRFYKEVLLSEKGIDKIISKNFISTISNIINNQKKIIEIFQSKQINSL